MSSPSAFYIPRSRSTNVPFSQYFPPYPGLQQHDTDDPVCLHIPEFLHGLGLQVARTREIIGKIIH